MRKIKIISLFITLLFSVNILFAQSVDEGKRFWYYERYTSAKNAFTKLVNANPNNIDAVYWLGQTYIGMEDSLAAKALYQKTLTANPNSPLLLVGVGQIALMEGNKAEARNRFETAISLSKGKDYNIVNAIARANVDARNGDAPYAIEKIMAVPENKRTADIWTTLGDAYRKMIDGANAQLAYQRAITSTPNNPYNIALANYMIGRIYQTQGTTQENIYMSYYNKAMVADPNFAPVLSWLSEYYYKRDINKAREYLDKYIAVADPDSKNCYFQASFLYASSRFQESISKANECIAAGGQNPYVKLYGLKAFAFERLGDSSNAKSFFETYFQKQKPENLLSGDYETYGRVLLKFPGNEELASTYIEKAVTLDTLESGKVALINNIANSYITAKNYNQAANWYARLLSIKKNVTKTDIFNAGYNYYRGNNYKSADSVFALYQQKYPEDILGVYMRARTNEGIDSTGALGSAKPYYEKVIQLAEVSSDTAAVKSQLFVAYNYMIAHHYNIKKDKAAALTYVDKILVRDPTNAQALANKTALSAAPVKVKVEADKTKAKTPVAKAKVKDSKTKVKK